MSNPQGTTPVPSDNMPAYALGWLEQALTQVAANDPHITDLEKVLDTGTQIVYGALVHGQPISISLNITP